MRNISRSLRISFFIIILLFSTFASFSIINPKSSTASAIDPLVQYDSIVQLAFADSSVLDTPIHPLGGTRSIQIEITYYNTVPQFFREGIGKIILFGPFKFVFLAPVHVSVENVPDWCTASIAPSDIIFNAFDDTENLRKEVTLQVAVNKQSTALFPFKLNVKATGDSPDRHIKAPPEVSLDVTLTPGYVPLISTDPGSTIKQTSPGEPVSWNIKISNNGNGEALVRSKIVGDIPEGWLITVNPQVIVPSLADGELNEKELSLTALPPITMGYYNENVPLQIELTPEFSSPAPGDTNSTKGAPIYLTLGIQLRGFRVPGFELLFLLSGILIFIIIRKYKISKKKF